MPTPHVDPGRCQGHGRCTMLAPDVFDSDEAGYAIVLVDEVPTGLLADVEEAIATCPERAISLTP